MDRKPEAISSAFFDAKSKLTKIKKFGITPDMSQEAQDELVESLSTAKALTDGGAVADYRKGQAWYVESLVEYSALSVKDQFEHSYTRKFAEQATEEEMFDALEAISTS